MMLFDNYYPDVPNVPNGDLPIFIPQESFDFAFDTMEDAVGAILGILQDVWDYFLLGINAIVGLLNMICDTILVPFQVVPFFPQIIGAGCLIFIGVAIVKSLR